MAIAPTKMKVRLLRATWVPNPEQGKGIPETIRINEGTVTEMDTDAALDAIERQLVERYKEPVKKAAAKDGE